MDLMLDGQFQPQVAAVFMDGKPIPSYHSGWDVREIADGVHMLKRNIKQDDDATWFKIKVSQKRYGIPLSLGGLDIVFVHHVGGVIRKMPGPSTDWKDTSQIGILPEIPSSLTVLRGPTFSFVQPLGFRPEPNVMQWIRERYGDMWEYRMHPSTPQLLRGGLHR